MEHEVPILKKGDFVRRRAKKRTFSIPASVADRMDQFPNMNWSAVVSAALSDVLGQWEEQSDGA